MVSILVFVELALDVLSPTKLIIDKKVSILVFVELALDEGIKAITTYADGVFQSLFSWNLLLMTGIEMEKHAFVLTFQSLFSWNLLLMSKS